MSSLYLKPCPFCGSCDVEVLFLEFPDGTESAGGTLVGCGFSEDGVELMYTKNQTLYSVSCRCCHIEIGIEAAYSTETQAVDAWNRRVEQEMK